MASPTAPRPGRALAIIALIVVALYGWMFISGNHAPKLGLDLKGGTSLTLKPVIPPGSTSDIITQDAVNQAVEILRKRVDAIGVAEATVTSQGTGANTTIVIQVPGSNNEDLLKQVGTTAKLSFRPVIEEGAPTPVATASASPSASASGTAKASPSATPAASTSPSASASASATPSASASSTPSPSASATSSGTIPPATALADVPQATIDEYNKLDCTKPQPVGERPVDNPNELLVTCADDGSAKYLLDKTAVEGQDVSGAVATLQTGSNSLGSEWVVNLSFNSEGANKFGQVTQRLINQTAPQNQFAVVLDGVVQSAPQVQAVLTSTATISGGTPPFTQQTATDLANVLNYGALPLAFEQQTLQTISPTLGSDQLKAGVIAGIIGLILVMLYCLLYYRALGLIAIASLMLAGLLTYGSLVLLGQTLGYTLSLAGIAGAIVSIGITADSFVVYFERIRDEMRDGRTMRVAIDTGWKRARRTILAADAVSMIAAVVLYFLSIGSVQGFAFTLGLTTIIDVVVVFGFTRPVLTFAARTKFFGGGGKWSGLNADRLGVKPKAVRVPATAATRSAGTSTPKEA